MSKDRLFFAVLVASFLLLGFAQDQQFLINCCFYVAFWAAVFGLAPEPKNDNP